MSARSAPRRDAVRRRWQFAQTTSHLAISSRMLCQLRKSRPCVTSNSLSRRLDQELAKRGLAERQVVELEDHWISLSAVHAWVSLEVREQVGGPFAPQL